MRLLQDKITTVVMIALLVFLTSPGSTTIAQNETREDYKIYLEEPLNLTYSFWYYGEQDMIVQLEDEVLTISNATETKIGVILENPLDPMTEVQITYNNQIFTLLDMNASKEFGLGHSAIEKEFGFLSENQLPVMEDISHYLSTEEGDPTSMSVGETQILTNDEITTMNFYIEFDTNITALTYEMHTGILISAEVRNETIGHYFEMGFGLESIDGQTDWFERIYNRGIIVEETNSSITSPSFLIGIIFLAIIALIILVSYISTRSHQDNSTKSTKSKLPAKADIGSSQTGEKLQQRNTHRSRRSIDSTEYIKLDNFPREVRICCNQTARLDEKYCPCGRAVPEDLRRYYNH